MILENLTFRNLKFWIIYWYLYSPVYQQTWILRHGNIESNWKETVYLYNVLKTPLSLGTIMMKVFCWNRVVKPLYKKWQCRWDEVSSGHGGWMNVFSLSLSLLIRPTKSPATRSLANQTITTPHRPSFKISPKISGQCIHPLEPSHKDREKKCKVRNTWKIKCRDGKRKRREEIKFKQ